MQQTHSIRTQWNDTVRKMQAITERAVAERRSLTADEEVTWAKMFADEKQLRTTFLALEQQDGLERSLGQIRENDARRSHDRGRGGMSYDEAWKRFVRTAKPESIPAEVRAVLEKGDPERRDLAVGTGSLGGYTVPQGFYNQLVEALKWYGGVRATRAFEFSTETGNSLPMPTDNDTTNTGALLGENTGDSTQDDSFGQVTLNAFKYTSKIVKVSYELMQDSAFDIFSFLTRKLGTRIARIQNTHFTIGDNSGKPYGFVNNAVANSATVTAASSTAIAYNDLINLKYGVDAAYRGKGEWSMNDQIWGAVLKLTDGGGRPLVLGTDQGLASNAPLKLLGSPVRFNNDMNATMTTGLAVMAFGDMSLYYIRNVMAPMLVRFDERFKDAYQVGFSVLYRGDGRLVDAGTKPIKILKLA